MPLRPPNGDAGEAEGLIPVILFPNQGGGYGYGLTRLGIQDSLPEGYNRTINMTVREGRTVSPSFEFTAQNSSLFSSRRPTFCVAWEDFVPYGLFSEGNQVYKADRTASAETDDTTADYAGTAFYDDGSGTAYLYAGTQTGSKLLQRRNASGTWVEADAGGRTGAANIVAIYVAQVATELWRTTNDYQVSVCPAASDPFDSASWGSDIQVGTNESEITGLGAIGSAIFVFKENGIWKWERISSWFENTYPVAIHRDNFPFVADNGEGGLFTALATGDIVEIGRFGNLKGSNPLRGKFPGRDTPRGPIMDMLIDGERIYALMAGSYRWHQSDPATSEPLKFYKVIDMSDTDDLDTGSITDYSTEVTDGIMSTVAALGGLDTSDDAFVIGFDHPFLAVKFIISTANTNSGEIEAHFSTGANTWSSATIFDDTHTEGPASVDKSMSKGASKEFAHIFLAIQDLSSWAKATYNSVEKYWLRVRAINANFSGTVNVAECLIIPYRGAPAFSNTNNDQAGIWEASGVLPKIIEGVRSGGNIIWNDVWTLPTVAPVGKMAITEVPTENSINSLMVATADGFILLPLPYTDETSIVDYPILARDASGQIPPRFVPSAVEMGSFFELRFLHVIGENLTPGTDSIKATFRWDDTWDWATVESQSTEEAVFEYPHESNVGRTLHTSFQLLDGATTDPVGPSIRQIVAWVRPRPDVGTGAQRQPDRETPEST